MKAEEVIRKLMTFPPNQDVKFIGTAGSAGEVLVTDIVPRERPF